MKKSLVIGMAIAGLGQSGMAFAGELCEKLDIEYVMEEARKYNHLAKDLLFKYEYNAKELLEKEPTPAMDHCLKQLMEPVTEAEQLIVSNKEYPVGEPCEKYELMAAAAKSFIRRFTTRDKSYFQTCLNNNPPVEESDSSTH